MDQETQAVFDAVRQLSPARQAELVEAVLESLPPINQREAPPHSDEAVGKAWGDEINRRREEVLSGEVRLLNRDEARINRRQDG